MAKITHIELATAIGQESLDEADLVALTEAVLWALPVIKRLWSNIPWWRKVILGVKALIEAIEALRDVRNEAVEEEQLAQWLPVREAMLAGTRKMP